MYENAGRQLDSLKTEGPTSRTSQCPENEIILQLAAGVLKSEQSEAVLKHVVSCDHCGQALRQAAVDFQEDATESEQALLAQLKTSKSGAQAQLSRRLAAAVASPRPTRLSAYRIRRPLFAFAAAAVIVALAWLGFRAYSHEQPSYATALLARSYSAQRTLEIRIPGAESAPMRVERGQARSRMDRPAQMLEAENIIARKLARNPDSPYWLQAKGLADLLDGNHEAAISSFEKALERRPDAPDLQSDLASAYFTRAESEDRASDYARALDLYGKTLQTQPDNVLVLFNRAITFERMFLYQQAMEDWEHYLRLDPTSAWSAEARRHLELLELKQRQRGNSSLVPLLRPEQFQMQFRELASGGFFEARIEEYQSAVLREWLLVGYPLDPKQRGSQAAIAARDGVAHIEEALSREHHDNWLHDLLLFSSSPDFPYAVAELSEAFRASERADYVKAFESATHAKERFTSVGNTAGVFRAEFELIFALHFSNNALECARESQVLLDSLRAVRYPWILAQARIEQGICKNLLGEFGPAATVLAAALSDGRAANYPVTTERALTMNALVQWSAGNGDVAWQQLYQGAANCWSSGCPAMTLYSTYANMDNFAEDSHQWHLQMALAKEAIATIGSDADVLMRAVEHNRLAKAAVLAQETRMAEENFAAASQLLAKAPRTSVTLHYQAGIQVDLAKLADAQGNLPLAEHYLALVRPQIPDIADHYILLDYFGILSGLKLREGELTEAEDSLRWAVGIAEHELGSLSSDRDRVAWMAAAKDTYSSWVGLELRRNHPESAFRIWEFFLSASLRSRSKRGAYCPSTGNGDVFLRNHRNEGPPPFPVPDDLPSSSLLSHHTLISYAIVSERLVAWVLDDRGLYFFSLREDATKLLPVLQRFLRDCASPTVSLPLLRDQGRFLHAQLIEPLSGRLEPGRTLLFDGDPAVVDIPLQVLVDKAGQYLAETHSSDNLPSFHHLLQFRPVNHVDANGPALIVSMSGSGLATQIGLSYLTDTEQEAEVIAQKFAAARLVEERDALPEVIEREIPRAVVFHYAGHTRTGSSGSGLLLAGSTDRNQVSILDAERVRSLHPALLQLAVLSACSTEGPGPSGLQDADSLALAFLESGVPHVIASRWEVDSATTTRLMSAFYDRLLAGESVSDAVRSAARKIRLEPDSAKPYYWAAFNSFGAP
jgi:CHAT domain-containing protein